MRYLSLSVQGCLKLKRHSRAHKPFRLGDVARVFRLTRNSHLSLVGTVAPFDHISKVTSSKPTHRRLFINDFMSTSSVLRSIQITSCSHPKAELDSSISAMSLSKISIFSSQESTLSLPLFEVFPDDCSVEESEEASLIFRSSHKSSEGSTSNIVPYFKPSINYTVAIALRNLYVFL